GRRNGVGFAVEVCRGGERGSGAGRWVAIGGGSVGGLPTARRNVADHGVEHRHHGHGEQCPGDAGDERAAGDGQDDGQRVQAHRPSHDQRLQDVGLGLLDEQDDGEHDQGVDPAVGDQSQQDGQRAGDQGADDGDEGAEEDQPGQRECQRDAEDGRADPDADGVDEGHEELDADVVHQADPALASCPVGGGAGPARHQADHEGPDAFALEQEEDQREQRQQQARGEVPQRAAPGHGPAEDGVAVGLQLRQDTVDVAVDVLVGQVQGPGGEPVLDLRDAGQRLLPQAHHAARHGPPDQQEQSEDDGEERQHRQAGGEPVGQLPALQQHDHRTQQPGQQGGDHQRDDQQRDVAQQPQEQAGAADDDGDPPAPRGGDPHAIGDVPGDVAPLGAAG